MDIYIDNNENVYVAGTSLDPNTNIYKCLLLKYSASGVLLWDEEYSAPNSLYNVATAITGDGTNVYIGGGTYSVQTETDYLALSYSASGSLNWSYTWDNLGLNDAVTNIYYLEGTLDLGGGTEVAENSWKYGIVRLDAQNGTYSGDEISGGDADGIDIVRDLKRDDQGNIYVTSGVVNTNTGYDFRTIKLDGDLNVVWSQTYHSSGSLNDVANGLEIDNSGNVYVAGYSETNNNSTDYRILKYNSSGVQQWVRSYDGNAHNADTAKAIILDSGENLIVTGVSHNGSNEDFHTLKYSPSGDVIWSIGFNGIENGDENAFDMAIDDEGDIIVSGQTFIAGAYKYISVKYKEADVMSPFGIMGQPESRRAFTENRGQLRDQNENNITQIKYYSRDGKADLLLSDTAMSFVMSEIDTVAATTDTVHRFDIKPFNGLITKPFSKGINPEFTNFYLSHLPTGLERVANYKSIIYPNMWENIDVTLTQGISATNYFYVLKPSAKKDDLKLQFNGQLSLSIESGTGDLLVSTYAGIHRILAPRAYQIDNNGLILNLSWNPNFLISGNTVTFSIGSYDENLPLVIYMGGELMDDFETEDVCWGTFYGNPYYNSSNAVQLVDDGAIFAGNFSNADMIVFEPDVYLTQNQILGNTVYLVRVGENYEQQWCTVISGESGSYTNLRNLAVSSLGFVYGIGDTDANNLPTTSQPGATYYEEIAGLQDLLLVKLDLDFGTSEWLTYMGGEASDIGFSLGIDGENRLYISGYTTSSDFPIEECGNANWEFNGALQLDAFIARFDSNDNLEWSTYFGGTGNEYHPLLTVGSDDKVYLSGVTKSTNIPVLNPTPSDPDVFYFPTINGTADNFLAVFDDNCNLEYSTYIGADGAEYVDSPFTRRVAVHSNGDIYFIGDANTADGLPLLQNGYSYYFDETNVLNSYLLWIKGDNLHQEYGSFLPSNNFQGTQATSIVVRSNGVYIAGYANHSEFNNNLPVFYQQNKNTNFGNDGFILQLKLEPSMIGATYFGGNGVDYIADIAVKNNGLFIAGRSTADMNFPLTDPGSGGIFYTHSGSNDSFMAFLCNNPITSLDNKISHAENLFIYPNPTFDYITIRNNIQLAGEIYITDLSGKSQRIGQISSNEEISLDLSKYPSSVFLISIKYIDGSIASSKLVKI